VADERRDLARTEEGKKVLVLDLGDIDIIIPR